MAAQRIISQETFDDAVRENMEDFDMSREDAIVDAIAQFTAQGVDLSNIVKTAVTEEHPVVSALARLRKLEEEEDGPTKTQETTVALRELAKICAADDESRTIAASRGAMALVLPPCGLSSSSASSSTTTTTTQQQQHEQNDRQVRLAGFEALSALCLGCPACQETLREPQRDAITAQLGHAVESGDDEVAAALATVVKSACRKNEKNRAGFVESGITVHLLSCIRRGCDTDPQPQQGGGETGGGEAVTSHRHRLALAACTAARVLTFDDDMRAEFGTAHVNAKRFVEDGGIPVLVSMLASQQASTTTADAAAAACATLSRLAVKDEYCKEIVAGNAVEMAAALLQTYASSTNVCSQGCALLKSLAGNDENKLRICRGSAMSVVLATMHAHLSSAAVQDNGCALIAAVTLRLPENAEHIVGMGGIDTIMGAMRAHEGAVRVQRNACMAIRNSVVRSEELKVKFRQAGVELHVRRAMELHPERCGDVAHAALRDLGCDNVEFKELWKGAVKGKEWEDDGSLQD